MTLPLSMWVPRWRNGSPISLERVSARLWATFSAAARESGLAGRGEEVDAQGKRVATGLLTEDVQFLLQNGPIHGVGEKAGIAQQRHCHHHADQIEQRHRPAAGHAAQRQSDEVHGDE